MSKLALPSLVPVVLVVLAALALSGRSPEIVEFLFTVAAGVLGAYLEGRLLPKARGRRDRDEE